MLTYLKTFLAAFSIVRWIYGVWQKYIIRREVLSEIEAEKKALSKAQNEKAKEIDKKPIPSDKRDILDGF